MMPKRISALLITIAAFCVALDMSSAGAAAAVHGKHHAGKLAKASHKSAGHKKKSQRHRPLPSP